MKAALQTCVTPSSKSNLNKIILHPPVTTHDYQEPLPNIDWNQYNTKSLSKREQTFIDILLTTPNIDECGFMKIMGISRSTLYNIKRSLKKKGFLINEGCGTGSEYHVVLEKAGSNQVQLGSNQVQLGSNQVQLGSNLGSNQVQLGSNLGSKSPISYSCSFSNSNSNSYSEEIENLNKFFFDQLDSKQHVWIEEAVAYASEQTMMPHAYDEFLNSMVKNINKGRITNNLRQYCESYIQKYYMKSEQEIETKRAVAAHKILLKKHFAEMVEMEKEMAEYDDRTHAARSRIEELKVGREECVGAEENADNGRSEQSEVMIEGDAEPAGVDDKIIAEVSPSSEQAKRMKRMLEDREYRERMRVKQENEKSEFQKLVENDKKKTADFAKKVNIKMFDYKELREKIMLKAS